MIHTGRHFLQIPGPTNVPDRVLRAMDRCAIDFNGAQFRAIAEECFAGLKRLFKTKETILGFDLLDCADLDEAIEVARTHPMAREGRIELRPFADFEQ